MVVWPLKRPVDAVTCTRVRGDVSLTAEAVQGTSLTLEGVDDVHGGDSLALGVLGVGDSVTDDVLQEDLENTASLLVDQTRDPLDTAPPGQAPDCWLSDALDVVSENLAMPLGSSLAEALATFATSSHDGDGTDASR